MIVYGLLLLNIVCVLRWHQQGNMNTTVVLTIHTRAPLDLGNALQDALIHQELIHQYIKNALLMFPDYF
jgi:hypothetical protein